MSMLTELQAELESARRAVADDGDHWEQLATGQDTEQAEYSGYLEGYLEGIKYARELLRKHGWTDLP